MIGPVCRETMMVMMLMLALVWAWIRWISWTALVINDVVIEYDCFEMSSATEVPRYFSIILLIAHRHLDWRMRV